MIYERNAETKLLEKVYSQTQNSDFEKFWQEAVNFLNSKELKVSRQKMELPYNRTFTTYDVQYTTHDDTIVNAYFSVPNDGKEKHPCVVYYHGGAGWRGIHADIVATGVCCFAIDVRGQGGTTIDRGFYHSGDMMGGIMTRGILDKNEFYMKNIYLDAIRAVDVVSTFGEVDTEKIVTYGASQGGALSIVASAFNKKVKKCYTAVTSYCCIENRVNDGTGVFDSTHNFLKRYPEHTDAAFDTISYFDINNISSQVTTASLFCVALADKICYPEYVYSAYAHCNGQKEVLMVPFAPHSIPEDFKMKAYMEFAQMAGEDYCD